MPSAFLLKGIIIGFSIAAPVGPIGVLCIRRTLSSGRISGFVSGLGAATADAFYGSVAGFGLTFISSFLIHQQNWLRLIGGLFLSYLGLKIILEKPSEREISTLGGNLLADYASTLFLTLTNPLTILSFAAIFVGLGIGPATQGDYLSASVLVAGVFMGSTIWWLILCSITYSLRGNLNLARMRWVNRISGIVILVFGVVALLSLI